MKTYYDPELKMDINIQYVNGLQCPYCLLKGKIYNNLAAYLSMEFEIKRCIESTTFLKAITTIPDTPFAVKEALLFSSVIRYVKCFNSGEGRSARLDANKIFINEHSKYMVFHEGVLEIRNAYLAHAGRTVFESRALIGHLHPDLNNKKIQFYEYHEQRLTAEFGYDNYLEIFKLTLDHIQIRKKEAIEKLAKTIDIDELYRISKSTKMEVPFSDQEI